MVGGDGEDSGVSTLLSGARGGPLPGDPGLAPCLTHENLQSQAGLASLDSGSRIQG